MGGAIALIVEFSDGKLYKIPARFIAERRARYYAELDTGTKTGEEFDKVFEEEVEFALANAFEITDWASNNENWSDVEDVAELFGQWGRDPDYESEWVNAKKYVRVDALKTKDSDDVIVEDE